MCDPVTAFTAGSGALGALTQAGSVLGAQSSIKAMNAAQLQEIKLQEQKMVLENSQQQRQILRNKSLQMSQALSNSVNQGAGPGSSGVLGGRSAISTNTGVAYNAVTQATTIGHGLFQAEREYANANMQYQMYQGIGSLGQSLVQASGGIGRMGGTLFKPDWSLNI